MEMDMKMEVSGAMAMGLLWRRGEGQPKTQGQKANVLNFGHETDKDQNKQSRLINPSFTSKLQSLIGAEYTKHTTLLF
jgi:hypothetical protein